MNNIEATLFTAAHARDLERFLLQRESIERCGVDLPHVVVVNDEDIELFRRSSFRRNLRIVSTAEVLSNAIEIRRRSGGYRRRDPRRWWHGRFGPPIHGWRLQQLIKLSAPAVVETPLIVCVDTDTFFVGSVTSSDFASVDGRAHLYETVDDLDAEMAEWSAQSMRFLGLRPTGLRLARYTHSPVVFERSVVLDLQRYIEARYNRNWDKEVADAHAVMEYTTYGVYAREVDRSKRVVAVKPPLSLYFWWPSEVAQIQDCFVQRVRDTGARLVGVQSNTGCEVKLIRHLAERVWPRVPEVAENLVAE